MNKKSGFTLIELLSVIVITSILLIFAIPKIINQIKINKSNALQANKEIIISSARNYVSDYNLNEPLSIALSDLCDLDYIECPVKNPVNDSTMNGYVNVDENKIYTYSEDDATYWAHPVLTVNLVGGSTTQTFSSTYLQGKEIILTDPTKEYAGFMGWSWTGTGAKVTETVVGSETIYTLTMGSTNTTVTAIWESYLLAITVNPNQGSYNGSTDNTVYYVAPSKSQDIAKPIRSGHLFTGWSSTCSDCMNNFTYTAKTDNDTLTAQWLPYSAMYSYTGSSEIVDDGNGNWRIRLLTDGTLTPNVDLVIDAFLVGGGSGGRGATVAGAGGGGGGYTGTYTRISLTTGTPYPIDIGAGGARSGAGYATTAFGYSESGGGLAAYVRYGCPGGSGGAAAYGGVGGSNGGNGTTVGSNPGGSGQASTTYEFGDSTLGLYSGGGGGGGGEYSWQGNGGAGGAGGGATGGAAVGGTGSSAAANTGGGGGGGGAPSGSGGYGGSGIVVIRNTKIYQVGGTTKFNFSYSGGAFILVNENTDDWEIKFISSGTFTSLNNTSIDAFLVGGGSGGKGTGPNTRGGGGGGGGRTTTGLNIAIAENATYSIVIGAGGGAGSNGGTTSCFNLTATGGTISAGNPSGSHGGSGGGGGDGGNGGSDGSNGYSSDLPGGNGQGTTTRAFGESTGALYAGGGGAGGGTYSYQTAGIGGAGGGANGGAARGGDGAKALPNTGGGGGGGASDEVTTGSGGSGGSGIVIIRAH